MKYRRLGSAGVQVSEISLGSWLTYGSSVDLERAERIIDTAYENGINFFDTANVYSTGAAEEILGKSLAKYERDDLVVATKVYFPMKDGPNHSGLSRKHILEQCNASLKRLGMDYVDILYCHRYDENTPLEETLRAIDDLITSGKVLYVGVSMWPEDKIREAMKIADKYLLDKIVVDQIRYNMLFRAPERTVMPVNAEYGIGHTIYCPLAQGVLTGKYLNGNVPEGSRAVTPGAKDFFAEVGNEENMKKTAQIKEFADELGVPLAQFALAWILRRNDVASAIIGASKPEQVEMNVAASGLVIPEEMIKELDKIL